MFLIISRFFWKKKPLLYQNIHVNNKILLEYIFLIHEKDRVPYLQSRVLMAERGGIYATSSLKLRI